MLVCGCIAAGFLSTPSARRATKGCVRSRGGSLAISIHALREEGDTKSMT